jgi:hypothetical protein
MTRSSLRHKPALQTVLNNQQKPTGPLLGLVAQVYFHCERCDNYGGDSCGCGVADGPFVGCAAGEAVSGMVSDGDVDSRRFSTRLSMSAFKKLDV